MLGLRAEGGGVRGRGAAQVLAQGGQTIARGLGREDEALRAGQPGQDAGLAAGAGAHVQAGRARRAALGAEERGGQHGRAVLDVDQAEERRQGGAQGKGFGREPARRGQKRLGLAGEALRGEEGLHAVEPLRRRGDAEAALLHARP